MVSLWYSISQTPTGHPQSIDVWYEIHAVSTDPTGWALETLFTLVPATWSSLTLASDQMAKMGRSMTSPPFSITEGYWWPNWGKQRTYCSHFHWWTCIKKLTNSEMEETCRANGEWRCVEPPFPSERSTLIIIHHQENSLNPNISVLLRLQEIALLIESLVIGHWFGSQCPSLFPEVQKLYNLIVLIECWVLRNERWEFLYCMVIELCSGNHHLTYERE